MKISFANFIFELTDKIGGDAELVAKSIGMDSRIGFKYLKPGLGFAGPCFPRDNKALIAIATSQKLIANLAIATDEINLRQPKAMFKRISANLNEKSHILIIGITYKYGSEVVEESQGIKLAHEFANAGFQVTAIDGNLKESPEELSKDVRFINQEEDFSQYDFIINANGSPFEIQDKIDPGKYAKY
jgi:UDPglucose 6-dehydrogenase